MQTLSPGDDVLEVMLDSVPGAGVATAVEGAREGFVGDEHRLDHCVSDSSTESCGFHFWNCHFEIARQRLFKGVL
ncbi:hypothetical protein ACFQO4_10935 [Saliphagus sp. GCM10025334]